MGLVTLAVGKGELDIETLDTTQDDRVTAAIEAASLFAESYCNRKFAQATYTHYFDGNDTRYLLLREFPVTSVTSVHLDDEWAFGAGTLVASSEYKVQRDVLLARRCAVFHYKSALAVKVVYVAGFATIPDDIQQAVLAMMKFLFYTRQDRRTGLTAKTKFGENVAYEPEVPPIVTALLEGHRRDKYVADRLSIFRPELVKKLSEGGNGQGES